MANKSSALLFSAIAVLFPVAIGVLAAESSSANPVFVPDFKVKSDDYTVLMACMGKHPEESKPFRLDHRQLQLTDWKLGSEISWEVEVMEPGDYIVNVLFNHSVKFALKLEVSCGSSNASAIAVPAAVVGEYVDPDGLERPAQDDGQAWRRLSLPGALQLPKGKASLVLKITGEDSAKEGAIELLSIELVKTDVEKQLSKRADAFRSQADTRSFRSAKYGLMFHWHTWTAPRHGPLLPYAEAVRSFKVEPFVEQVLATGAGFVTITTSHSDMVIPAPIKSLDAVLPGRTSERDLIGEIADALNKHGVKLFLYYHLGSNSDPAWQKASGFWETDTTTFWKNWCAVIGEMGDRYGDKLAGWWFDDGTASYYYRSAPWEKLANTALRGNPKRLVGFNSWILPPATEFQHLFLGESQPDPTVMGTLKPSDNGMISSGMYRGLQASAALTMEQEGWGHSKLEAEIGPPRYTAEQLTGMVRRFEALGNVPIFNCSIYQDGTFSPKTVEVIQAMNRLLAKPITIDPESKLKNE